MACHVIYFCVYAHEIYVVGHWVFYLKELFLKDHAIILSLVLGLLLLIFGSLNYLALMLVFFVIALVSSGYMKSYKLKIHDYEEERSWKSVVSNGLFPLIFVALSPWIGVIPYVASIAAVTADKCASELGVMDQNPIFLGTLKRVKPGKSGAISGLGLLLSLAGSFFIGLTAIYLFHISIFVAFAVGIIGFLGGLIDSLFGILEERKIGNKETTNIICSIFGGLLGYLLKLFL